MNDDFKNYIQLLIDNKDKITQLPERDIHNLLDYITNLQQEKDYYFKKNNELSTLNTSLRSDRDNYKSRIEKAVEYLEKEKSNYMRSCDISNATNREGLIISSAVRTCDDTLKILRGNNDK